MFPLPFFITLSLVSAATVVISCEVLYRIGIGISWFFEKTQIIDKSIALCDNMDVWITKLFTKKPKSSLKVQPKDFKIKGHNSQTEKNLEDLL